MLEYLISHRREPDPAADAVNSAGETPLHVAVRLNRDKFFFLLVDRMNASVGVDGLDGRLIHYALKYCHEPKKRAEIIEKVITLKNKVFEK